MITLSADETKVLRELYIHTDGFGENYLYFRTIARFAAMDETAVRKAAHALRDAGLAQYRRGLMTDDGMCAGSGYGITGRGISVMADIVSASS